MNEEAIMLMKTCRCLALLTIGMWVLSCVPPFYGRARVEEGYHCDVAGGVAIEPEEKLIMGGGVLGLRYGFNKYLQVNGQVGVAADISSKAESVIPFGGLGLQTAARPFGSFTPAIRIEGSWFLAPLIVPTFILGIGQDEWLTLCGRGYLILTEGLEYSYFDAYVVVHPPKTRLSIVVGTSFLPDATVYSLGIGYEIE